MSTVAESQKRDLQRLEKILWAAQKVRTLDKDPRWKTDIDAVMDEHGDACDIVWSLLNEMLDIRKARGEPVAPLKPERALKDQMKKLMIEAVQRQAPAMIESAILEAVEGLEL